jgi:very-short-patch-repair endonuclease
LVIEVDGPIHDEQPIKQNDAERQKLIESEGLRVLRFTNNEVMIQSEAVIQRIQTMLHD